MRKIVILVTIMLFVVGCGKSSDSGNNSSSIEQTLNPTFYTINGEKVSLDDFKGKPVVLNAWASWCPPCKSELPAFQTAYDSYKSDVNFLMMDLVDQQRETKSTAIAYINENGYTFPVYFDEEQNVAYEFRINQIPMTYFLNSDGTPFYTQIGAINESALNSKIEELIENNK